MRKVIDTLVYLVAGGVFLAFICWPFVLLLIAAIVLTDIFS